MNNSVMSQSSSYSVLTFVTDELRSIEIPIGVALWSSRSKQPTVELRVVSEGDKLTGFKHEWLPYLDLISSQLKGWLTERKLPYASEKLRPEDDAWWRHLRNLLVHRVRISEPKAIDCKSPHDEIDLLFDAVVHPQKSEDEKRHRVDRALIDSLGSLSKKFSRGTVTGFYGRPVPVKRFLQDGTKLLVLEGVNLATIDAEKETDALVSRLLRINAAERSPQTKQMVALVGYLTSPGGLNGEAALVKWIEEKAGAKTFDLVRNKAEFADSVESQMYELGLSN